MKARNSVSGWTSMTISKNLAFFLVIVGCGKSSGPDFAIPKFGDQVGNGGKIVVCRGGDDAVLSMEPLDFYEARVLGRPAPSFGDGNFIRKAHDVAARLATLDSDRSRFYVDMIDRFVSNAAFVESPLMETMDSDHIVAPPDGCAIEQAVIQAEPQFPTDRLFTITKPLWDGLDENGRAGLVLHEVLYYDAIARGHKNSIAVRYVNAWMSSNQLSGLSPPDYDRLMQAAKLYNLRWVDGERTWTYLDSIDATWKKASKACRVLLDADLPEASEVAERAEELRKTPLEKVIRGTVDNDTWTASRREEDGKITAYHWSESALDRVTRASADFANVLCVDQPSKSGGVR